MSQIALAPVKVGTTSSVLAVLTVIVVEPPTEHAAQAVLQRVAAPAAVSSSEDGNPPRQNAAIAAVIDSTLPHCAAADSDDPHDILRVIAWSERIRQAGARSSLLLSSTGSARTRAVAGNAPILLQWSSTLSNSASEPLRVLGFWRDLEVFNIPAAPSARDASSQTKITTLRHGDPLPWQHDDFKPTVEYGYVHVVYLGVADTEALSRLLLRAIFPDRDLSERERQRASGNGWLAAFVADEHGCPKPDSYLAASFAHGAAALRQTDSLENVNARLSRARDEFAQRCHRFEEIQDASVARTGSDSATAMPLTWDELRNELQLVRRLLGSETKQPDLDWRMVVRSSRVKRRYLSDNLQAATDFLNSFYLDDLDRLIAQARNNRPFGAALSAYLGRALEQDQRTDILVQHAEMAKLLSVAHLPSARWPAPSEHPLVLAQQAAVAQVLHTLGASNGVIGVNGPPGTGKTTLLCDVIAEIVTERARRIAALDRPVALFEEKISVAGKGFYPLKASVIAGTSIVVASTNNNAVKNITQELPARKKVAGEYGSVDYFAKVMGEIFKAQKVLDDKDQPLEGWGVIAAALGNAGNRRSFAQGFFRDEYVPRAEAAEVMGEDSESTEDEADQAADAAHSPVLPPSMKQLLEVASNDDYRRHQDEWQATKLRFLALLSEFEQRREALMRAEQAAQSLDAERGHLDTLQAEINHMTDDIAEHARTLSRQQETLSDQRAMLEAHKALLAQRQAAATPNLQDRLSALFGRETQRMAVLRRSLEEPAKLLAESAAVFAHQAKEVAHTQAELERRQERLKPLSSKRDQLDKELQRHRQALDAVYALGTRHFPDTRLWELPNADRQRASVAVYAELDQLRAQVFLQAVELHRLSILANAGKFIANLRAVNGMLMGTLRDKLPVEQRPTLWDAFFFVVPVVSTTLASFDRLFLGMGQDSLGWLLLDEAGQATPQSAAGALWRSRRAVIVGDPLQIEPVFTVPLSLAEDLRQRNGVDRTWSPVDESVQTLADRITPFGSWVAMASDPSAADTPERLWTGMPLRTHRRCDAPMFSVANEIAYAGQMVQGRVDAQGQPKPIAFSCILGESAWMDVRSTQVEHPVCADEIAHLLACLERLRQVPAHVLSGSPDEPGPLAKVFVISPFRKVVQACKPRIKQAGFSGIECGTVHTFQGKEAEIVFFVLGTAPGSEGAGARAWAAGKPNLLNVAITRAKCRLYVLGDVQQWGGLDYFRQLREALPVQRIESTAASRP
ncbi:DEAD/DEAH box helicase [Xanthomonas translucens]|uniref:DEAD/DEAH box helicase n=1 Tax=Xanthomonas campestris pv. translucens TaxID=343 RepID=UPI001E318E1B|nr:ATP-binding protein [Xanthomonas translucens]UJB13601.1 AAA domain-containing protein [Xanthomonas translucens pv. undulosa]UPU47892.1 AAA domain-containing protein [Xanthomonas translucens pv. undulosa]WLA10290.1 AAA domain-containing protein [Xanthomonas translucens]